MSHSALARAVRDRIRAHADYLDRQVDVEINEKAPATAGDLYIIVTFGQRTNGGIPNASVADHLFGIDVTVAIKAPRKPRDRERDFWIDLTNSFEVHERNIRGQIENDYPTINAANVFITAEEGGSPCGFMKPLRFDGAGPFREAPAEIFAGTPGEQRAAIVQTLRFSDARRIEP